MRIAIRTDGDSGHEAGMGHVVRSLALARFLQEQVPNLEVRFLMRSFQEGVNSVLEAGYPVICLPYQPKFIHLFNSFERVRPDIVLIDTLGSTLEVMTAARSFASMVVTLDDLEPSAGEADVVINGILWATRWLPPKVGNAHVYQGVEYIPLRPEFATRHRHPRSVAEKASKILVNTGGADIHGLTVQIMNIFREIAIDFVLRIVIGPALSDPESVRRAAAELGASRCEVIWNTSRMGGLMLECDLSVVTAGTVLFECAACGLPAVVVSSYEHQVPAARWFAEKGTAIYLGNSSALRDKLGETVTALIYSREKRDRMSRAGRKLVDGRGLERTGTVILSMLRR